MERFANKVHPAVFGCAAELNLCSTLFLIRHLKKVTDAAGTAKTEYVVNATRILHMKKGSDTLHFYYDGMGRASMVSYNGTKYTYVHNLQGDIVGILDASGSLVVEYSYDAWGKPTAMAGGMAGTLGALNPFRYRGYVWDEETGLYYLQSRYYNPDWCRFINADNYMGKVSGTNVHNLYAYCVNSPTFKEDRNGFLVETLFVEAGGWLIGAFGGAMDMLADWSRRAFDWSRRVARSIGRAIDDFSRRIVTGLANMASWLGKRMISAKTATYESYEETLKQSTYYLAVGNSHGLIIYEEYPMDYIQAIGALTASSAANVIIKVGAFAVDFSGFYSHIISIAGKNEQNVNIGIYTKDQMAAEGLASLFGGMREPEISSKLDSAYYHYHDASHSIHIWYGIKY